MEIAGKIVVVTGGASGIGRALVEAFRAAGAGAVVSVDRAAHAGGEIVDVADEPAIAALVQRVAAEHGPIDIFCSNAGVLPIDPDQDNAASLPNDAWQRAWEVNVMAHVYAARALLPGMIARKSGYFVQTVSAAGLLCQIGAAAYSTTKHAAIGFAESLAITHRDHGIKVAIVCPQAVETAMITGQQMNGADIDGVITAEDVARATLEGIARDQFLILPHPSVATYITNKAAGYDRWIGGMTKLRRSLHR